MDYAAAVTRHFFAPANGGTACGTEPWTGRGEAGSRACGTWIVFRARVQGGRITALSFQAYGCPHVIAACSRITEILSGRTVTEGLSFDVVQLMAELEIPPQKHGRLLIAQDALRNCCQDWDTTSPAGVANPFFSGR